MTNTAAGEHTVTKPRDWLIAEGEAQLRSRKMPDDAHLEAMEVSEPEARGIMSIMAMKALENKDQPYYVVTQIGRSLGAKAKNYKAYNPISGEQMPLTEGTRIVQPKNHIIAGNGRNRQIDELQLLLDTYGGDPLKWTKEKGFGYVDDEYGESHYVELHWYQEPHTGRVKMKIKVQSDGRIYLDDE